MFLHCFTVTAILSFPVDKSGQNFTFSSNARSNSVEYSETPSLSEIYRPDSASTKSKAEERYMTRQSSIIKRIETRKGTNTNDNSIAIAPSSLKYLPVIFFNIYKTPPYKTSIVAI